MFFCSLMESDNLTEMDTTALILCLIPALLSLLLFTIILFLWYSGFFIEIDIKTCKSPLKELQVAYKYVKGSHKDCSLVYAEAHSLIPHLRCIGIYYDNPREVNESCIRSIVGLILNDNDKTVSEEEKQRIIAKGFQITKFPAVEHVVYAAFPHTSFLSVLIAIHKLLPAFRNYIQDKKLEAYPLLELCDGERIVYMAPLSNQSEFFVYEALAESEEEATSDKTMDDPELSSKDLEELPDTLSSVDSLLESGSRVEELPSNEAVLDSLEQKDKTPGNSSEASTESFEELQLDS